MEKTSRNQVIFLVLSAAILIGWFFLHPLIWPPPPKPQEDEKKPPRPATAQQRLDAKTVTSLLGHFETGMEAPAGPAAAYGLLSSEVAVAGSWASGKLTAVTKPPQPPKKPRNRPPIVLGSEDAKSPYFLKAVVTPKGAGIRQVTINRFQKADTRGRPVWSADDPNRPEPLELVAEERNTDVPSALIYSANPEDVTARPMEKLGKDDWDVTAAAVAGKVKGVAAEGKNGLTLAVPFRNGPDREFTFTFEPGGDLATRVAALKEGDEVVAAWADAGDADGLALRGVFRVQDEAEKEAAETALRRAELKTESHGVTITKAYSLEPGKYHLGLDLTFTSQQPTKFRYHLTSPHGLPIEGEWYTNKLRDALIGRVDGNGYATRSLETLHDISRKAGGDEVVRDGDNAIQYGGVGVQFFASVVVVDKDQVGLRHVVRARPVVVSTVVRGTVKKIEGDKSFVLETDKGEVVVLASAKDRGVVENEKVAVVGRPDTHDALDKRDTRDRVIASAVYPGEEANQLLFDDVCVHLVSDPLDVGPEPVTHKYLLYNGPVKVRLLGQLLGDNAVQEDVWTYYNYDLHLNTMTDAPWQWWGSWLFQATGLTWLLISITNVMHGVLYYLHFVIPSWGLCIIALTLLVRMCMFPVSRRQALMTAKMQALAPEIKKLQEKFKDDRQALGLAQMDLYKKHGVSPLGSCWVVFLQMPIFLGLYYCLQESIHFRLSPFLWIVNLAAPDMLWPWFWPLPWSESIPFISTPASHGGFLYLGPYFNLLPVIVAVFFMFQQKMMTPPPTNEQEEMNQRLMKYMPILFALMFFKVAAGLCIYFITSSVWGFTERTLLKRKKADLTPLPPEKQRPGLMQMLLERFGPLPRPELAGAAGGTVEAAGAVVSQPPPPPRPSAPPQTPAAPPAGQGGGSKKKNKRKNKKKNKGRGQAGTGGGTPNGPAGNGGQGQKSDWWADVRRSSQEAYQKAQDWVKKKLKDAKKK